MTTINHFELKSPNSEESQIPVISCSNTAGVVKILSAKITSFKTSFTVFAFERLYAENK